MASPFTLFEISWEVCNKVGGIHTVVSTKAKTLVEHFGDEYIAIGPWLLSDAERAVPFEEEGGFEDFTEACRAMGLPTRVGRWKIPGRPRTILVEFSGLYGDKDGFLSGLWEDYGVDSISGTWDYIEPVLFGIAAGKVIEEWWDRYLIPSHRRSVTQAHEWMTGSSLLYLAKHVPSMGTIFTSHATMLGRALSSVGHSPDDGLGEDTADELAETHNVVAKHSIEGVCARQADVFTTVSEITAKEAALLHERMPEPLTPNGIDLEVIDAVAGETTRDEARARLADLASRFLGVTGAPLDDALFLCVSGRYEFHNKGMDLLLDAVARMNNEEGRPILLFILVPAGNSGPASELLERMQKPRELSDGPLGISTHNLFDEESDPVHVHCAKLGLDNSPDARVKVIQIPIYLTPDDGLLNLPYEAVLRAMDLSAFPSYYEPWGYTPQESLAVGVRTLTTDYAGFGRWAQNLGLSADDGITVLERVHVEYPKAVDALIEELNQLLERSGDPKDHVESCRRTAQRTAWTDLVAHYHTAFESALEKVQGRMEKGVLQTRRPKLALKLQPVPEGPRPRLMTFDVSATLPESLRALHRLARNFWWCWDPEAAGIFEELSPMAWEACGYNPVRLLQTVYPEDLKARAADRKYTAKLKRVIKRFDEHLAEDPAEGAWTKASPNGPQGGVSPKNPIAYFCAEFGIQESLRIYSGGLGVLAGDHLKSASDLNLPLVAVGLFYRKGYLTQRLSSSAEQIALDAENDPRTQPLELIRDTDGSPLEIRLQLPGRELSLRAWRVRVGRVALYLLDADTPSNSDEDREITRNLYGGENEMRLKQEIALGRGGVRLLRKIGIEPSVCHMNEGHAAFTTLERVSNLLREGLTFEEARELVRATTLFTTHTPVPAGHDRFSEDLMRRYFSDAEAWVGVPWERFVALGQTESQTDSFNMTYLALNFASYCNGVSELHGDASRKLLHPFWPGLLESGVPVRSITNGIHLPTWTHPAIASALGASDRPIQGADFEKTSAKAMGPLWKTKQGIKEQLMEEVRVILRRGFLERHDSPALMNRALEGLTPKALVIGFARRFAPYKRATLMFQDLERLRRLLDDDERPLRILIAGKAHPKDQHGKDILSEIAKIARRDEFVGKVFFIEDYDMHLARFLVQGVDVWLNNPTRLLEASGTSGMKVSANGGLNLSIGDGWWPEGFDGENGWVIAGGRRVYDDQALQDQFDSGALYQLLEEELIPTYFQRNKEGQPTRWLQLMRRNLMTIPPVFNTDRMVMQYFSEAYAPLGRAHAELAGERRNKLRTLVNQAHRVRRGFASIKIVAGPHGGRQRRQGGRLGGRARGCGPGPAGSERRVWWSSCWATPWAAMDLRNPIRVALAQRSRDGSVHTFEGSHVVERSGDYAYGLRVCARQLNGGGDPLDGPGALGLAGLPVT